MKRILFLSSIIMLFSATLASGQPQATKMPIGKKFYIQSAINYGMNNGGYWDIPGKPTTIQRGSNIQVWTLDEGHDRIFTIIESPEKGYYELQVGNTTNARVDIAGGKREDATNVQVWDRNGNPAQRFQFRHIENGRFKIFDRNGRALCLAKRSSANGSNLHIWGDHNGTWMEWYLIDVQTKNAFIPKPVSTTPDFFIKNKNFSYRSGGMVSRSEGKGVVKAIQGNVIMVEVSGTNYNSDVPPGQPTQTKFSHVLEIRFEDGQYIINPDIFNPGELSEDGKTLNFSGDAYMEFTVEAPAPKPVPTGRPTKR